MRDEEADEFCPYAQLPGEGPRAFEAFTVYRDLGPRRSIRGAAEKMDHSATHLRSWSHRHTWAARVRAWDAEVDRQHRHALLARQREVLDAHRELARAMRQKAQAAVANTAGLDAEDVVRWVNTATRIETQAYGLADALHASPAGAEPQDRYFDALPKIRLMRMAREAIHTLELAQAGEPTPETDDD